MRPCIQNKLLPRRCVYLEIVDTICKFQANMRLDMNWRFEITLVASKNSLATTHDLNPESSFINRLYRVSHIEVYKVNWLWQVHRLRFLISYHWLHVQEVITFGFYQPVFKTVTLAGLNSLRQKGYQISVKNWIFDDPFY